MIYEAFLDYVKNNIKNYLPEKYAGHEVRLHQSVKNNDILLDSIMIQEPGNPLIPNIYLNPFYEHYQEGVSMEDIMKEIARVRMEAEPQNEVEFPDLRQFHKVKDSIYCRLVNLENNMERLQAMPFTPIDDLAVTYHILVSSQGEEIGSIALSHELLNLYGVEKEELHNIAVENTQRLFPENIFNLCDFIGRKISEGMEEMGMSPEEIQMQMEMMGQNQDMGIYVLTNDCGINGAAAILYPDIQQKIGAYIKNEFYVLPCSVHELILIDKEVAGSIRELQDMVKEVNETEVKPDEVLSGNVYEYKEGRIQCLNRENNKKQFYLCCDEDKKEYYREMVNSRLGEMVEVVDFLQDAQTVYVIGQISAEMEQDIQAAKELGLNMVKVNEQLVDEHLYEHLRKGNVKVRPNRTSPGMEI